MVEKSPNTNSSPGAAKSTVTTNDQSEIQTTADRLWDFCAKDRFPNDPDTFEDYKFPLFGDLGDRTSLLGLYVALRLLGASSKSLHEWRIQGTLADNIIKTFEEYPPGERGGYYHWFLDNIDVFKGLKKQPGWFEEAEIRVRTFLSPADQHVPLKDLEPPAKMSAGKLLLMICLEGMPEPCMGDIWYSFGFCTCRSLSLEGRLLDLYIKLLLGLESTRYVRNVPWRNRFGAALGQRTCSFEELWKAHQSRSLIQLIDSCGLRADREPFEDLEGFLDVKNVPPSVWHLKHWLRTDPTASVKASVPMSVFIDYGFLNCEGSTEERQLRDIYERLLGPTGGARPLELANACTKGRLWSFASKYIDLKDVPKRLMKNPYPL